MTFAGRFTSATLGGLRVRDRRRNRFREPQKRHEHTESHEEPDDQPDGEPGFEPLLDGVGIGLQEASDERVHRETEQGHVS
jgi:hypothetical protein